MDGRKYPLNFSVFFLFIAVAISSSRGLKTGKANGWTVITRACNKQESGVSYQCRVWASYGYCKPSSVFFHFMSSHCPLACNLCVVLTKKQCGACNKNQDCVQHQFNWYTKDKKLKQSSTETCQCKDGWTGSKCDLEEIDECLKPNACHRQAGTCLREVKGSYRCFCTPGFKQGKSINECVDIDECAKPYSNACGGRNETCINSFGSFNCECQKGFVRKRDKCVKTNVYECPANQFMDKKKRCQCRKTIAKYSQGVVCYDCNKINIGVSEHSKIPDYAFSATSEYNQKYGAFRARGRSPTSWAMKSNTVDRKTGAVKGNQYLEIDLLSEYFICAVAVVAGRSNENELVKTYQISYLKDSKWIYDPKIYEGPNIGTANGFKKVILSERPRMRKIRIHPKTCNPNNDCAMRLELFGQRIDPNGKCTINADKETFTCKCNKGYIGDGSTCTKKLPYRIIGKAGFYTYKKGQVLSVRNELVKFLPDGAKTPVIGHRFYDFVVDVIPDRDIVENNHKSVLFRKDPKSDTFFHGIITKKLGKDTYSIKTEVSYYQNDINKIGHFLPDKKQYTVKLRDMRYFELGPKACNSIKNSIYVGGEYPGAYSCLCPYAGEQPSDGGCKGNNKFLVATRYWNVHDKSYKYTEASISFIDSRGVAWLKNNKRKDVKSYSDDIFNYWLENANPLIVANGDRVHGMVKKGLWVYGKVREASRRRTKISYGVYRATFSTGDLKFTTPEICNKMAACPINSTCIIRKATIPSTYSCVCNGPVLDNVCTKPIQVLASKRGNTTNVPFSNVKASSIIHMTLENTHNGVHEYNKRFNRFSLLEKMADSTSTLYGDEPFWLLNKNDGKPFYTLGNLGGRVLGEKESVVFVPEERGNMSLVEKENLFKEIQNSDVNALWSCQAENQCGRPGEGICVSTQVWNYHYCVCAEGFKNFWGPKGETCVPMDYV